VFSPLFMRVSRGFIKTAPVKIVFVIFTATQRQLNDMAKTLIFLNIRLTSNAYRIEW